MKAKQSELELTARNALIKARQADIEGQDKRAREILSIADSQQKAARNAAVETAKLESAALNRVTTLVTGTLKTTAEVERFERQKKLYIDGGMSELEAAKKAFSDFSRTSTQSPYPGLNFAQKVNDAADDFFNKPEGIRRLISVYNAANKGARISPTNPSPEDIKKVIQANMNKLPSDPYIQRAILERAGFGKADNKGGADNKSVPFSSLKTN